MYGGNSVPYTDIVKLCSIVDVIRSKTVSHEQVQITSEG